MPVKGGAYIGIRKVFFMSHTNGIGVQLLFDDKFGLVLIAKSVGRWGRVGMALPPPPPPPPPLTPLLPARASEQGNVIGLVSMSSKKICN